MLSESSQVFEPQLFVHFGPNQVMGTRKLLLFVILFSPAIGYCRILPFILFFMTSQLNLQLGIYVLIDPLQSGGWRFMRTPTAQSIA